MNMKGVSVEEVRERARQLREVLAQIDAEVLAASAQQRAFIAGALSVLEELLAEIAPGPSDGLAP